ncbi:MAG: glycosyltransferase [Chloroflexi bacterium]|nr:glycosyltransferase [Chloroflexota bacterium]
MSLTFDVLLYTLQRILIFFSDTGGGHRAAANALREGFHHQFPERYEIIYVDGFKECAPFPFNQIPLTYFPLTTYTPWLWSGLFHFSNTRWTLPLAAAFDDFILRRGCANAIRRRKPALVISVHPLINRAPCNALRAVAPHTPFVTVITDLFDAHGMWFSAASDLLTTPTQGAFERGVRWGFPQAKMRVVGQPIALQFAEKFAAQGTDESVTTWRARLNLKADVFTLLLVGGGEGMGPLRAIARALDEAELPIQLAIIAGRNDTLRVQLQNVEWRVPVNIQGFVTDMPDWMRASDVVITKAGPGTIMETLAAGKPMILSGNLPGQEEGNVTFVEKTGVGVLRTTPEAIVKQVRAWLAPGNPELAHMQESARREARPAAALEIVKLMDALLR